MKPLFYTGDSKCHKLARYFIDRDGTMVNMNDYCIQPAKNQLPVVRGLWDDHIARLHWLHQHKIPFAYVDNAYFLRNHQDQYYRVAVNQLQESQLIERPSDRWMRFRDMGVTLHDWKENNNGPIVLCPPTIQPCKMFNLHDWLNTVSAELKKLCPRRDIVVRMKPRGKDFTSSFQKCIERAYCVITHNSIAAVEAAMFGIPVIVDKTSAAMSVGLTNLADINSLRRPDRAAWMNMLSYGQWSVHEILDGQAWDEVMFKLYNDPAISLPMPQMEEEIKTYHARAYGTGSSIRDDRFSIVSSVNKLKGEDTTAIDFGSGHVMLQEKLPDVKVTRYDPAIKGIDKYPTEVADIVVCTDVLQFIKESELEAVLSNIYSLCSKYAIFVIDTRISSFNLSDGRNAHLTVKPAEWWITKLQRRFELIAVKPIKNVGGAKIKMIMKKRKAQETHVEQSSDRVG